MPSRKVQTKSGSSLADTYDVVGSIAGIDALDLDEIKGVHELGSTIMSERLQQFQFEVAPAAVAQSLSWDTELASFQFAPTRILQLAVFANQAARITNISVMIHDNLTNVEVPIFTWNSGVHNEYIVRADAGGGVSTLTYFEPALVMTPTMMLRNERAMPSIFFRGTTSGFGAGSVVPRLVILIARPGPRIEVAGTPRSHGLPLPGW